MMEAENTVRGEYNIIPRSVRVDQHISPFIGPYGDAR